MKDINIFDEFVVGLVKLEYWGLIIDLLIIVCEVLISSFVYFCYEVIKLDFSSLKYNVVRRLMVFCLDFDDMFYDNDDVDVFYDMGEEFLFLC